MKCSENIESKILVQKFKPNCIELFGLPLFTAMFLTDELVGQNHLDGPAGDIFVTLASIRPHPRTTRVLL